MGKSLADIWRSGVIGTFLAGLTFLLPVTLTIAIIIWIANWFRSALGPNTFFGDLLTQGGARLVGPEREYAAYGLGILITLLAIWLIGIFIRSRAKHRLEMTRDWFFNQMPIFRTIYKPVQRVVSLISEDSSKEFSGMSVVRVKLGGVYGAEVLALLTSDQIFHVDGEEKVLIYIPTSPVPMSGGLLLVARKNVHQVEGMKVDDLMKIYLSLGVLATESVPDSLLGSKRASQTQASLSQDTSSRES